MSEFGGGKCPNLGVGNVRILGVVNVLLANDSQSIEGLRELMVRLTEQFFQHPVSKLMFFPKQPSREVHLESKTESQEIYFHSHKLICIVKHIFHSHSCISQFQ